MSYFIEIMEFMKENNLSSINTCMICTVESFHRDTVDVITKTGHKLIGLPISRRKYKEDGVVKVEETFYEKGDKVVVIFSDEALDNIGERKHDLVDGIVIGVI